jgi:hypothetical protein
MLDFDSSYVEVEFFRYKIESGIRVLINHSFVRFLVNWGFTQFIALNGSGVPVLVNVSLNIKELL